MKIQFNTDKTISGAERQEEYFATMIEEGLQRFDSSISRIEVHVSDKNGIKEGINDIDCLIEARLEGRQPIAVSAKGNSTEIAVSSAIKKMKASLETILGRAQNH